ncbi:MAG TPA: hypothetical protein VD993_13665 [Chitinophagaceae bacterium]|nr:hypothetical protein [Chitinophagaceae bacterium]
MQLLICLCCAVSSIGQDKWQYSAQFNAGCHLNITYGKAQRFPGLRVFGAFSVTGVNRGHLIVHYGPSVSIYTKTIGANLNPLVGDIQVDLTNTFSIGYGWGDQLSYNKHFRTIHTGDYHNMTLNIQNAGILSTNFILNNHKRNQIVGSVTASFGKFTFNYYNDGAFPFDLIPIADNFDRYWTGGGAMFFHTSQEFNRAELSFDQFTGYTPLLYEVSNLLGINLPLYKDEEEGKKHMPHTFNTSAYQLKVHTDKHYAIDVGTIGKLVTPRGYHYGIQDLIHMALRMSLHPNNDINRYFFGGTYKNGRNVKL